jgi:hypothetical protein
MAINPCSNVQILYKGDGTTKLFTFPFTYIAEQDIDVYMWNGTTKEYVEYPRDKWSLANATTIEFIDAPPKPDPVTPPAVEVFNIKIGRSTDVRDMVANFYPGSAIRAEDLNDNFDQLRLAIQENRCQLYGEIIHLVSDVAWNKFSIINNLRHGDTIFEQDQKEGRWTRGLNDKHIATTDAIGARLDPYVQDTIPAVVPLPGAEQEGKTWFDTQDLVQRFWDAQAKAWVTLANTGPQGLPFQTMVSATQPLTRNDGSPIQNGDAWFNTTTATLFINYDDGDSKQWVSTAKAGPPGPVGPQGPEGPPGPIAPGNGVGINAAKQIIVIDDGTF